MLEDLKQEFIKGTWTRGSVWEFDWYLDVFFVETMVDNENPVFLGYREVVLGDEYLGYKGKDKILDRFKNFFLNDVEVEELIRKQHTILDRGTELIQRFKNHGNFDKDEYESVQKDLSQLMASVSVVFDQLISDGIKKIASRTELAEQQVTNFIIHQSSKTVLNRSNSELQDLLRTHEKEIQASDFQYSQLEETIQSKISSHVYKYGWLNTGESGSEPWDEQDFLEQIKSIADIDSDINQEVHLDIRSLSQDDRRMIKWFVAINLNDNKAADVQIELDYLFQEYLKHELQEYYDAEILENLTYQEITEVLADPIIISNFELRRNNKLRVVAPINDGILIHYFDTKEEFDEMLALVPVKENASDSIKGYPACLGLVEGVVRIVRTQADLDTFKKGEILVAEKTQPKYVTTMTKASAIVTDIGGITSHAAIISREFQIPCVVGTSNATKVLNNGDKIRVDAEKGEVVKL